MERQLHPALATNHTLRGSAYHRPVMIPTEIKLRITEVTSLPCVNSRGKLGKISELIK
jgi:hypothetical protein